MADTPADFIDWSTHPGRSLEERFGVELLLEQTESLCRKKDGTPYQWDYEGDRQNRKGRSLDPAYQPNFQRTHVVRAAQVLPEFTSFHMGFSDDRPLRDISFLRFCPALNSIHVRHSEIRDWSPVATLPALTKLDIWDNKARDLRVVGGLTRLTSLSLWLSAPWPDLAGLDRLVNLHSFTFRGNVLALKAIPRLESVRTAIVKHGSGFNVPLRSIADLPDMPELRCLELENTSELDGIERYTELLNLIIYGYYTDLSPLARLQNLTHLFLSGGDYPHIVPLSRMAALHRLTLCIEFPPDLTPLADSPRLHEILLEISPVVPAELASLNALAPSWDEEFAAAVKRPLKPLRLRIRASGPGTDENEDRHHIPGTLPRDWGENLEMGKSEYRWFVRKTNRRITRLLGKGWGTLDERFPHSPGQLHITITRPEDIDRLPEIATALRKVLVSARHPWTYFLIIDSLARFERDMDEIRGDDDEFDAQSERQEWEYHRQKKLEHREYLQRKYRHQLSLETGIPVPPPTPAPPSDEAPGDLADDDEPEYDLGTKLELYSFLNEHAVFINARDQALAEMLFEMKAEPPPPED